VYFIKNYSIKQEYIVIRNGISIATNIKKNRKTNDNFEAIIVGSTYWGKGLDIAITTIDKLNDAGFNVKLNVIGFSDFSKKTSSNIKLLGRITPGEVQQYYQKSDFLLFPTRHESGAPPLVVLEALQNNLPIIISKTCKADEIFSKYNLGCIVEDYDVSHWFDAVSDILNVHKYNRLLDSIENGKAVLLDFNWDKLAISYERFLLKKYYE